MRKLMRMMAGVAVVMLSACSADSDRYRSEEPQPATNRVSLTFDVGVADLMTRGDDMADCVFVPDGTDKMLSTAPPRQICSSNNWQQVNDVRIYIFKQNANGDYTYYRPDGTASLQVSSFADKFDMGECATWWGGEADEQEQHKYKVSLDMPNGLYRFLAVARDDARDGTRVMSLPDSGTYGWVEGVTTLGDAAIYTDAQRKEGAWANEIFTGCTGQVVVSSTEFDITVPVSLTRAVAGLMVYVTSIPDVLELWHDAGNGLTRGTKMKVKYAQVMPMMAVTHQLNLLNPSAVTAATQPGFTTPDGQGATSFLKLDPAAPHAVKEINPLATFGSTFVFPQMADPAIANGPMAQYGTVSTLALVFFGARGDMEPIPVQWWPIRISNSSGQTAEADDPYLYPLRVNYLYTIGRREYTPDGRRLTVDEPFDLSQYRVVDMIVDPTWDGVHDYVLGN